MKRGCEILVLINGGLSESRIKEIGWGRLISPRSGNALLGQCLWAADNDAFLAWDEKRFLKMLDKRDANLLKDKCLFVACPDVVGSAAKTLSKFWSWREEITLRGFPVALVLQDGQENLEMPWTYVDAVFVGGSTEWKLSCHAETLIQEAKARGKWVHMGRVNTKSRYRHAVECGVDSVDGTGFSRFPDVYISMERKWANSNAMPRLF